VSTPVRDASTVVLLRDGFAGVEAWLLTRVRQMAFAAGMTVFPGGRVEASDRYVPWAGTPAAELAVRLSCGQTAARALVGAAVLETFEETGVLLSTPGADLRAARSDVESGRVGFAELLRAHGLAVDASSVSPWARWITPEGEPRRYDTRFFVAALPPGATAEDLTSESSVAGWVRVADAVAQYERGERPMYPPTIDTLRSIDGLPGVVDVLDAAGTRSVEPVRPLLGQDDDGAFVELPDGTRLRLPR
jgi:8-oxo-dGTP pyrophosphatase MutT (NUDIX family)